MGVEEVDEDGVAGLHSRQGLPVESQVQSAAGLNGCFIQVVAEEGYLVSQVRSQWVLDVSWYGEIPLRGHY